jgi:hypothetical protein
MKMKAWLVVHLKADFDSAIFQENEKFEKKI